jgi:hypothetical protein
MDRVVFVDYGEDPDDSWVAAAEADEIDHMLRASRGISWTSSVSFDGLDGSDETATAGDASWSVRTRRPR